MDDEHSALPILVRLPAVCHWKDTLEICLGLSKGRIQADDEALTLKTHSLGDLVTLVGSMSSKVISRHFWLAKGSVRRLPKQGRGKARKAHKSERFM